MRRNMRRNLTTVLLVVVATLATLTALSSGSATADPGPSSSGDVSAGAASTGAEVERPERLERREARARRGRRVVVRVTGNARYGFGVHYADGRSIYPPTDSEALAECAAYQRRVDRVKCRARFRTWYRDLATLERSLAWARRH